VKDVLRDSSAGRRLIPRTPLLHRLPLEERETAHSASELARDSQLALVEAALFAADEPLTPRRLATVAGISKTGDIRSLVQRLHDLYDAGHSPFQVEEVAGGYQLLTRPDFHPWLVRLRSGGQDLKLSGAAREALTIVAYRQPITRADIENIRGVQTGDILRQLMEKGLIRIAGRDPSLGRPVLYGTTKKFLQLFGLKSLRELPAVGDLMFRNPEQGDG
jgi:segregation and condensation protein B